jgi:hypothetical protein
LGYHHNNIVIRLADQRILVLSLRFEHGQRVALFIQQQEVDEVFLGFFKVQAQLVDLSRGDLDVRLKDDVGFAFRIIKKAPAGFFEKLIDLDSSLGFFLSHLVYVRVPYARGCYRLLRRNDTMYPVHGYMFASLHFSSCAIIDMSGLASVATCSSILGQALIRRSEATPATQQPGIDQIPSRVRGL